MDTEDKPLRRATISKSLSVQVFRRDSWLCRYCGAPVVLAQAMKHIDRFVRAAGFTDQIAYHHRNWTRTSAPLLDYLGAEVDHVKAHSRGGEHGLDNFVTACHKCNLRKSATEAGQFGKKSQRRKVKSKYGEPLYWDGLSTLFIILADRNIQFLDSTDRAWLRALKAKL